jgi:hypothetical protein
MASRAGKALVMLEMLGMAVAVVMMVRSWRKEGKEAVS